MPKRLLTLWGDDFEGRAKLLGAAIIAAVSVVALGATLVYRINTAEQITEQTTLNCRNIENLKAAISGVLIDAKTRSMQRNQDPAIRKVLERYYDRQLARFAPADC